ncbi:unnamed protein product [Pseudo-nitzschia multistriata]|uniref:tRNA-binding domain-containing protein n=1 Tax=Pseudo-nitzschia multistriata TaxID=183589 RepID=A0A448Z8A4_9STRA|nr:unnamed protein product [Pseudo-nitzschia multistriata]
MKADSAIVNLTVSTAELHGDPLLQLVTKAASPLQLTVKTSKKASLSLELLSGFKLTQRNSIIRCLCGMGLHNALDGSPYYLLGGHASTSKASPYSATALASLTAWMSLAGEVRNGGQTEGLLEQIDSHLQTRAFLIDSPSLTVADVDLAVALVRSKAGASLVGEIPSYSNVHRWIVGIQESLKLKFEIDLSAKTPIPAISNSHGPPIFFYGNETNVVIPKAPISKAKAAKPVGGNNQQQQGQNQSKESKKEAKAATKGQQKQKQQQQQAAATFDVSALDIRVGKIVKAWHHPDSEKLFCEEIDLGEEAPRQIASGLRAFYKTEELEGRRVLVLCNLKSRKLVGFPSHGMVLCASNADHTAVECMEPPEDAPIGTRIMFEGYDGEPEPENKIAKKKIFEKVAPDLKTDANGVCVWKGAACTPSIKASKGMPNAQVS